MGTAKQNGDDIQREVKVDVDALLDAIQSRSSGEVQEFMANEDAHRLQVQGKEYGSYSELVEAFELDIRDFSISEVNR